MAFGIGSCVGSLIAKVLGGIGVQCSGKQGLGFQGSSFFKVVIDPLVVCLLHWPAVVLLVVRECGNGNRNGNYSYWGVYRDCYLLYESIHPVPIATNELTLVPNT